MEHRHSKKRKRKHKRESSSSDLFLKIEDTKSWLNGKLNTKFHYILTVIAGLVVAWVLIKFLVR
jgi:hypothetical protein